MVSGTAKYCAHRHKNIFVALEPLGGKRFIKVTDQRKKTDFAHFIKELLFIRNQKKYDW